MNQKLLITSRLSMDKETCEILYTTYKQCYGLGIQLNSTDACLESAGELSSSLSRIFPSCDEICQ